MTKNDESTNNPKVPKLGIQWPLESGGRTTNVAKDVWSTAALTAKDEELSEAIKRERNWRFGYAKHISKLNDITASSSKANAKAIATSGLNELLRRFVFVQDDKEPSNAGTGKEPISLFDLCETHYAKGNSKFCTKKVEGTGQIPTDISFPYKKGSLNGSELEKRMSEWSENGTCEEDCSLKVQKVLPSISQGSLKGKWFVLLGAGSEMGPLNFLLTYGANVIAVRTKKSKGWLEMAQTAQNSAGCLYIPILNEDNTDTMDEEWSLKAGCDILTETIDIRDWIIDVLDEVNENVEVTVGLYTYLDSEAHVRVTLGCDVIMVGLEKAFPKTRFAFIGSSSVSTAITHEMATSVEKYKAASPFWMKATRCQPPHISKIENVLDSLSDDKVIHLHHGFVTAQGPNYALAKTAQIWRAMVAKNHPSFCVGPITKTASVCHNPTMAAMLKSYDRVKPYEIMDPPCASTVLGILLAYDVLFEDSDKDKDNGHPFERTLGSSFHSGDLRGPYNVESSKCLSGILYVLGRYF